MQKIIYDIIHGNIEYSNFEGILLKNPIVNRLHQILQNSTAYRVYPNLKTSRFEHSLGVMNYSGKMYRFGLLNSKKEEEFLQEMMNRLNELVKLNGENTFKNLAQPDNFRKYENHIKERYGLSDFSSGLSQILENPIFINDLKQFVGESFIKRNVNPVKDKFEGVNILLYQSVRFFGLTHDIGHLPLSHLFEFALEGVYENLADNPNRNSLQEKYFNKLKNLLETKVGQKDKIHELIGKKISKFIFHEIRMNFAKRYNSDHDPNNIVSILITYLIQLIWKEMIKGYNGCFNSIYSIVAGTIDSDRLDFVRRDGYLSGVLKSPGNIDRIIEMCCLGKKAANMRGRFDDEYSFMPSVQSLNDVEEVLHHRFRIYKYVVNHHAVRRSDYIFQKVIENKLLFELEQLENTQEKSLLPSKLITVIDIADKILNDNEVIIDEMKEDIRKLTQLTDFWLLSVLNKDYISYCENEPEEKEINKENYEYLLLSEVYENRKKFKSLWKRTHQFRDFLILLAQDLCQQKIDISQIVNAKSHFLSLYNHCLTLYQENELEKCKKEINNIENGINEKNFDEKKITLIDLYQNRKEIESKYAELGYEILTLANFSSNIVHKIEKEFLRDGFFVLLREAHLKSGIKTFELINRNCQEEIMEFKFFSHKEETINNEIKKSITFFVYFIDNEGETARIVLEKLKQKINKITLTKITKNKNYV